MSSAPHAPASPVLATAERVVITGGAGFVGRAAVGAFRDRGVAVTVVDRVANGDDTVRGVVGELTDPAVLAAALDPVGDEPEATGVVHLAAITSVLRSVQDPAATYDANVRVTQDLLEGCRARGVGRFVMASTNAVVGDVGQRRVDETVPLRPLTPYGATKAACEMLLAGYSGSYGIAAAALRFTNVYGPGMGHKDSFVPRIMRAALSGGGVQVYGDGRQQRDLVHVDDVVSAIVAAYDRSYTGTAIVGFGASVTVLDMIEAVRAASGCAIPVEHVPAKPGEMPAVIVDVSKARADLGYRPSVSLTEGLAGVWKDFCAREAGAERT